VERGSLPEEAQEAVRVTSTSASSRMIFCMQRLYSKAYAKQTGYTENPVYPANPVKNYILRKSHKRGCG
jgi:hypothetical protein